MQICILVLMLRHYRMVCDMSQGVFDEIEELFMINMAIYQRHLVVLEYLAFHPIWDIRIDFLVGDQLEFFSIGRICLIRIKMSLNELLLNKRGNINSRISGINAFQRCLSFLSVFIRLHIIIS
jgi:hypothetical protein